jgi:glycosyltransferase involved in cell wall biosynthesis
MKASVVIPSYNSAAFVREAVESALSQTVSPCRVIVVDDGSTDETRRVLEPLMARIDYCYQQNQGVSAARNAGLSRVDSDYCIFLDADDVLEPDALEQLLRRIPSSGDRRIVYGDVLRFRDDSDWTQRLCKPHFAGDPPHPARAFFDGGGLTPSAFLVPTGLARAVEGFQMSLSYAADMHFLMRCGCHVPFVHVPRVTLRYRVHKNNMSHGRQIAIEEQIDARLLFQAWCQERGIAVGNPLYHEAEITESIVSGYFYLRQWEFVDVGLDVAAKRGVRTRTITRMQRLRMLPSWVFHIKDVIDQCRRRVERWMV